MKPPISDTHRYDSYYGYAVAITGAGASALALEHGAIRFISEISTMIT